jgi:SAM-dependent methyltransferase
LHQRIPTRNHTGWSSNTLNELSAEFVQSCKPGLHVLDIGAALGIATLPALARGATVIANDSDPQHLNQIAQACPPEHRDRLHLVPGRFPRQLTLPPASLDAIHASNVLHFLTGRQLEIGAQSMRHWLKPNGKLFLLAATPYSKPFAPFLPEYERRVEAADPFPGWIENTRQFSTHRLLDRLPKSIHLLDPTVLTRVLDQAGFRVTAASLFRRRDLPASMHLDGRECVRLIAQPS